jgi:hypothetical protein
LYVVWHPDQDRALGDAGHETESLAVMLIRCCIAGGLLVRRLGSKIIYWATDV